MKYPWKEASTLILMTLKKPPLNLPWNYELVMLERSSKSSFMPNGCVFPGGTIEPADCDEAWLDIFSSFKLDLSSGTKIIGQVPPMLAENTGKLPKLLSLKIAAVRETFEETGILLCFAKDKQPVDSERWTSFSELQDLDFWKEKVHENANEFLNMCQKHNLCPDVNNIHLWSNWLTPTSLGPKRFDTAFFVASLSETPSARADNKEISNLSWFSPGKLIELRKNKKIWLPPPQVYEILRLIQFKDVKDLNAFSRSRAVQGCERWMPTVKRTLDASVTILPGDDAYEVSSEITPTQVEKIKMSSEEFRSQSEVLHRIEVRDKITSKVVLKNYKPKNGHVLPAEDF